MAAAPAAQRGATPDPTLATRLRRRRPRRSASVAHVGDARFDPRVGRPPSGEDLAPDDVRRETSRHESPWTSRSVLHLLARMRLHRRPSATPDAGREEC